uniref:JmjC domain-containing protein n=1 Tax=Elaeophora elaphi TaxID=1147741 RepID=A0A0R3RV12_9BILA
MIGCEVRLQDFDVSKDGSLLEQCHLLCREVFGQEYGLEKLLGIDDEDKNCRYVVAQWASDDSVIGVCCIRSIHPYVKLERVAVRKKIFFFYDWQGRTIGHRICRRAIELAECLYSTQILITYSHLRVIKFFDQLGFMIASNELDSHTLHKTMFYFPRRDKLPTLDLWRLVYDEHKYTSGGCFDPAVIEGIKGAVMSFKEQNIPRLVNLQHLPDESVVGYSLIRTYRECALATLARDFTRSKQLENFLISIIWEKLNTGHYADVDEAWRIFYASIMMCKAVRLKFEKQVEEALLACDIGLIMGRDIDGFALSKFAHDLHCSLSSTFVSLQIQKPLQPPSPLSNSICVDVCELPSFEEMLKIIENQKPVIIRGLVNQWPAFTKWNFSYFNETIGHRTVPIEIGSSYADSDWKQTLMTFHDFIKKFVECENSDNPGYLAQHRLFDQIPELLDDIIIPDYCAFGEEGIDNVDMNIWIGPAGTVSPLHFDPKNNIFCQVVGRKFLRMVPAAESENVYPRKDGILTNTSQLDVRYPDITKFPRFCEAHVFDCVLDAGECLFIPAGFWHYVLALDPSMSVSCWFTTKS